MDTGNRRNNKVIAESYELIVVGGGLSGVCCSISAARRGIKTALIQDRPVLGGNASSEIRVWALGATSHMGNNNRWSREGGVIDEIMVENMWRNKEGNPMLYDALLLEKVNAEPLITLLLNTAVFDLKMSDKRAIEGIVAFNSQNSTLYQLSAKLFCDASGDGILGYLAGASFHFGLSQEYDLNEKFMPSNDYGGVLGHTIFFYTKQTDKPVNFVAPGFALKDVDKLPKIKQINPSMTGCNYWWFEYGGDCDTVYDSEQIKMRLLSIVYGVWNHIKNSGLYPQAQNMTLEWVGAIPGKRESRRFEGLYMLTQNDIIEQNNFDDAVAYGGWAIDLHPAKGIFSSMPSCNQYHSKGIYSIPYRCYVSSDIDNLFIAGRLISASHVAFGSTRVMITCALGAQAVGQAAAMCIENSCKPAYLCNRELMHTLQQRLLLDGQSIPHLKIDQYTNLLSKAALSASDTIRFDGFPFNGEWRRVDRAIAQLLPLESNTQYGFELELKADEATEAHFELCSSLKPYNYTPDNCIEKQTVALEQGTQHIKLQFTQTLPHKGYAFLIIRTNNLLWVKTTTERITGIVSTFNLHNEAVNNHGAQDPPKESGFESFEFFTPERRPNGQNIAVKITPALDCYSVDNLRNGYVRPYLSTNAWAASTGVKKAAITATWREKETISSIRLFFDTDYDHAMESIQWGHSENRIPFCIAKYRITDQNGKTLFESLDNHQTINTISFANPVQTDSLRFEFEQENENIPVALYQIEIN